MSLKTFFEGLIFAIALSALVVAIAYYESRIDQAVASGEFNDYCN